METLKSCTIGREPMSKLAQSQVQSISKINVSNMSYLDNISSPNFRNKGLNYYFFFF